MCFLIHWVCPGIDVSRHYFEDEEKDCEEAPFCQKWPRDRIWKEDLCKDCWKREKEADEAWEAEMMAKGEEMRLKEMAEDPAVREEKLAKANVAMERMFAWLKEEEAFAANYPLAAEAKNKKMAVARAKERLARAEEELAVAEQALAKEALDRKLAKEERLRKRRTL